MPEPSGNSVGTLVAHIGAENASLNAVLAQSQARVSSFAAKANTALATVGIGGAVGLAGLALAYKNVITIGAQFQYQIETTAGTMRASAREMEALRLVTLKLGEETEYTSAQAAEAALFLARAGFDLQETIGALPGVLDLATAGNVGLARSADIASNALRAMQLPVKELGRVNDVFVGTFTRTNTTMETIAESFSYAAAQGQAYGYSIEQLSAMIGVLGNAGIKGSMAGTQLAMAFTRANQIAVRFGFTSSDLLDVLDSLTDRGASAQDIMDLFGIRAGRAALILKDLTRDARNLTDTLHDTEGEAKTLADRMRGTLIGEFRELQSVIERIKINIFDQLSERATSAIRSITEWFRENQERVGEWAQTTTDALVSFGRALTEIGRIALDVAPALAALSIISAFVPGAGVTLTVLKALAAVFVVMQTRAHMLEMSLEDTKEALDTSEDITKRLRDRVGELTVKVEQGGALQRTYAALLEETNKQLAESEKQTRAAAASYNDLASAQASASVADITARLGDLKAELDAARDKLERFRSSSARTTEWDDMNSNVVQAELRVSELQRRYAELGDTLDTVLNTAAGGDYWSQQLEIAQKHVRDLNIDLDSLRIKRIAVAKAGGPEARYMLQEIDAAIAGTTSSLNGYYNDLTRIRSRIRNLQLLPDFVGPVDPSITASIAALEAQLKDAATQWGAVSAQAYTESFREGTFKAPAPALLGDDAVEGYKSAIDQIVRLNEDLMTSDRSTAEERSRAQASYTKFRSLQIKLETEEFARNLKVQNLDQQQADRFRIAELADMAARVSEVRQDIADRGLDAAEQVNRLILSDERLTASQRAAVAEELARLQMEKNRRVAEDMRASLKAAGLSTAAIDQYLVSANRAVLDEQRKALGTHTGVMADWGRQTGDAVRATLSEGMVSGILDDQLGLLRTLSSIWEAYFRRIAARLAEMIPLPSFLGGSGPASVVSAVTSAVIGGGAQPRGPQLASGGITTGPTSAMIGEVPGIQEAVIPLDTRGVGILARALESAKMRGATRSDTPTTRVEITVNGVSDLPQWNRSRMQVMSDVRSAVEMAGRRR